MVSPPRTETWTMGFSRNFLDSIFGKNRPGAKQNLVRGEVDIPDGEQKPENPGVRTVAVSTYGVTIPVSMGARRVAGNIIEAGPIIPRLEGSYKYYEEYEVPLYDAPGPD